MVYFSYMFRQISWVLKDSYTSFYRLIPKNSQLIRGKFFYSCLLTLNCNTNWWLISYLFMLA